MIKVYDTKTKDNAKIESKHCSFGDMSFLKNRYTTHGDPELEYSHEFQLESTFTTLIYIYN